MTNKSEMPTKEERLERLENSIKRIDRWMENQDTQILNLTNELQKERDDIGEIDKKTSEAKKEITTFTLELVSSIIGFLSIMIAVVVLWINKDGISKEMIPIYVAIAVAFIVLFMFFVGSWILKNFGNRRNI